MQVLAQYSCSKKSGISASLIVITLFCATNYVTRHSLLVIWGLWWWCRQWMIITFFSHPPLPAAAHEHTHTHSGSLMEERVSVQCNRIFHLQQTRLKRRQQWRLPGGHSTCRMWSRAPINWWWVEKDGKDLSPHPGCQEEDLECPASSFGLLRLWHLLLMLLSAN